MTKKCFSCQIEKNYDLFNKNIRKNDGLQSRCRDCQQKYDRIQYRNSEARRTGQRLNNKKNVERNQRFVWQYLQNHGCVHCPENDPIVLTFDHYKGAKNFNICDGVRHGYSLQRIQNEIEKCQVLCANCHMRKNSVTLNWYSARYSSD